MKKKYIKPEETVVEMKMHQQLLDSSAKGSNILGTASDEYETY